MEIYIDEFITEYELDKELKDPICELFGKCVEALAKHLIKESIPEVEPKSKAAKVLKADKIEDPATCESYEQLNNCSTGVLNEFCGNNGLKKGGNKKELKDRVWRHLQGTGSDEDKSPRNKPKKEKKVNEKHACSGCNAKGAPCSVAGTEDFNGTWFCWRHITDAEEFLKKKGASDASDVSETEEITPSEPPATKTKATPKSKVAPKKKGKKSEPVEEELETDEE